MQLLLLQDVSNVGRKNDLVIVGDGFALNHLLPRRIALVATPLVRKRYASDIRRRAEEREQEKQLQVSAAAALTGVTVRFTKKTTKTGKLFAAISAKSIAQALEAQAGITIAESAITIEEPIKALGTHTVTLTLAGESVSLPVIVAAETTRERTVNKE